MNKENKYEQLRKKAEALLKEKGVAKSDSYYGDIEKLMEELNTTNEELNAINEELNAVNTLVAQERKQFLSILDSIPELIYVADFDTYEIVFANQKMKENVGKDVIGEKCYNVLQGKTEPCDFCTNKYIIDNDEPYIWEYYNPIIDKHYYVMDRKIRWTDQKEVRFEMAIDITDRKRAEKKLAESEDRFKKLSAFTFEGIVVHNNGIAVDVNQSGAKMLGLKKEQVIGSNLFDFIHPDYRAMVKESMIKQQTAPQEIIVVKKDGTRFHAEIKAENILYDNEYYRVVSVRDITERIQAEKALKESERKFRLIAENTSDRIILLNARNEITYASPAHHNRPGAEAKDIQNANTKLTTNYLHPEDREATYKKVADAIAQKKDSLIYRYRLSDNNKDYYWNEDHAKFTYDENGVYQYSIIISRNITDRIRAEEALRKSEEKYRLIAENVSDVITILNLTKRKFTYISPSVFNLRGYTPEEAMQQSIDETFTPESAEIVKKNSKERIQQLLANPEEIAQKVYVNELQQPCKDGSVIWTETTTRYHINGQKEIEVISVSRNIEERKKHEQIIKNQNVKLKEAVATKDQFISILGHDLRSPFNSIFGFSDLLLQNVEKFDTPKIKKIVGTINNSAKQTFNLLNNLLEWSRSQRNKIPFNPQATNLFYLVQDTYLLLNSSAEAKKIEIQLNVPQQIEATVDSEMLKTVIRNLISNAIKFTPENGTITVSAKSNAHNVQIDIADTGRGMDEETKNSLFKIGETQSTEGTHGERGTGFGLLLCKEFVDKHNGTISVESEIDKGSSFVIKLPVNN